MKLLTDQRYGSWKEIKMVRVEPLDGDPYFDCWITPWPPIERIDLTTLNYQQAMFMWGECCDK